MPFKPKSPCHEKGCVNVCEYGEMYCAEHLHKYKRNVDAMRGSANSRGYNAEWRRERARYLNEHPLCEECRKQGRYTAATEVHHIRAHRGDQTLFWDRSNWQALCKACHSAKTRRGE